MWFLTPRDIEYRMSNKEPQNYEVLTSKFDIPCSIFCGSEKVHGESGNCIVLREVRPLAPSGRGARSPQPALSDDLRKDDAPRNRDIKRLHLARAWNPDQLVALLLDGMAEPPVFTPQDQHHIPLPVEFIYRLSPFSGRADDPQPLLVKEVEGSAQIDHLHDR